MKNLDLIYKHFTTGLSESEHKSFDARLKSDAVFREEVADYQFIFKGLKGLEMEQFLNKVKGWEKEMLEEIEKEYQPVLEGLKAIQIEAFNEKVKDWPREQKAIPTPAKTPVVKLRTRFLRYAAAAVLALCLGFVGIKWYASSNYSTDSLVANNYHPRKTPTTLSDQENAFNGGFQAYKDKDFPRAIEFFSRVPEESRRYAEAQLFLGYAYFEAEQLADAANAFEIVTETKDQRFADNAEWHLLLSHFKENPSGSEFSTLLKKIAGNPQHGFHDEALKLEASLSGFWRRMAGS